MDFEGGPGRAAGHEPDDAREGQAGPAPGSGEVVGLPRRPGDCAQVNDQLRGVRGHHGGRGRTREGELDERILSRHRRDCEHAHEHGHGAVGVRERAERNPESQAARQEARVQNHQSPAPPVAANLRHPFEGTGVSLGAGNWECQQKRASAFHRRDESLGSLPVVRLLSRRGWPSLSAAIQVRTYPGAVDESNPGGLHARQKLDRRSVNQRDVLEIEGDATARVAREEFLQPAGVLAIDVSTQREDDRIWRR